MTKKKDLITHEEVNRFLKRVSYNKTSKSNLENVLKLLQELQIILDEGLFEDSIDGTRIRVKYDMDISRRRRGEKETGEGEEKQRENAVRYQYIKEIPIDYSKVPISCRDNANIAAPSPHHVSNNDINEDYVITESYNILEEASPTLYEILGLLKRIYFMPEDFSNRLAVDRIHRLRNMFSKDEILTLPSIDLSDKAGLIPI